MWNAFGQGAFAIGYAIYKSRVGLALHQRTCAECTQPHSEAIKDPILPNVHVSIIPMLHDNYAYLIVDEQSRTCLAVDPADPDRVLDTVRNEGLHLAGILTTHAHWDHAGGNEEIRSRDPSVKVYGSNVDNVAGLTDPVKEGDVFCFPPRSITPDPQIVIQVWEAPCHTKGHLLFLVCSTARPASLSRTSGPPEPVALFTGDTLFGGGTGKFFEGSAKDMAKNLVRIAGLPEHVKVFCGHEYTVNNYRFAAAVEPDNVEVQEKLKVALERRRHSKPTMPTTVGEEVATNPYMRVVTSRAGCGKLGLAICNLCRLTHPNLNLKATDGSWDSHAVLAELRRVRDDNVLKVKDSDGSGQDAAP